MFQNGQLIIVESPIMPGRVAEFDGEVQYGGLVWMRVVLHDGPFAGSKTYFPMRDDTMLTEVTQEQLDTAREARERAERAQHLSLNGGAN